MVGRTDGWTDGRMDGRTDGWTDGRMDGRQQPNIIYHIAELKLAAELKV